MLTKVRAGGLGVVGLFACATAPAPEKPASPSTGPSASAPAAEGSTAPSGTTAPTAEGSAAPAGAEPVDDSARPPDVPPAALATLGVNDIVGHPARWNDEAVILFARLRYQEVACTKSVPPTCSYQWQLVDAKSDKSMVLPLAEVGIAVPTVCRPAKSSLVAPSPCAPDELDPTQRYRLEGRLRVERGSTTFVPTRIEAVSTP